MKKISVVIVEDNRLLRDSISSIIMRQPDIRLIEAFGDSVKALQSINGSEPDIVLMDIGLANQNITQLIKVLKKDFEKVKVIAMDIVPSQEDILSFIQAGVSGFILKDASVKDFLGTIKSVACGTKVLPPGLTESLFSQIIVKTKNESDHLKVIESVKLTKREQQVMELVAEGAANKEIAEKLNLSTHTVKSHIHNILEKLKLHTRIQIIKYSRDYEKKN